MRHAPNLYTRAQFLDRLGRELVRRKSCIADRFVVLSIDIDRFKSVTSSLGHSVGEDLLAAVVTRLSGLLGARDAIGNMGGDEFAILMEEPSNFGSPSDFAARIQKELIGGFRLAGTVVYTTASIGIARVASSYAAAKEILRDAEIAMYTAKARGRARTETFHPSMRSRSLDHFELGLELRRALANNEFKLFFQPIVSAVTGRVHGFESLLRWRHTSRGMLKPSAFMDALEETGLIVSVGDWAINEACRQARIWHDIRLHNVPVTINVSPQQFSHPDFVRVVTNAINVSQVDARGLVLEITEEALLADLDAATQKLTELRGRGLRVIIDDFGTGYSSLSYVRRLPVDAIKLDAAFVDRIEKFAEDRMIVRAVIAIAHALDLRVVAEGIERHSQLSELTNLECEEVQGYMISHPVDADAATRMIETRWVAEFAAGLPVISSGRASGQQRS